MNNIVISGIQQVGIGVSDVKAAWKWYHKYFGYDVKIFEEAAPAEFMLPYTGGKPRQRHAILAINLQGGGGFEIWQYTDRTPQAASFEVQVGDIGIYATKIKCKDVKATYEWYKNEGIDVLGKVETIEDKDFFYLKDPWNNVFQIIESDEWFRDEGKLTGGACGVVIGVKDVKEARVFYNAVLGYDHIVYDRIDEFKDLAVLPGGNRKMRRVLLSHSKPRKGAFSPIFGSSEVELVQLTDSKPKGIFEDRFWGDLGFIHLCFDINGMDILRERCKEMNFPFTVDVGKDFDMGEAAGTFSYNEDPSGTLIEYVETYKVPVMKKLGWYISLKKRDPEKPLPMWMLNSLKFNKVKNP